MAFSRDGWGPLGGQSKAGVLPALYVYTTTDAHTAVDAAGYFNSLSDELYVGDMIFVRGSTGGTATLTCHIVVSNASGVVDIGDGTVIGVVTDSD
jgi:dihydrodipicolinate synthase/N-acetylneuraminate lyase|tara:strand:+ start:260 stop:544 length:285 start_codon:yes stop_codon:yes gene_type:complete